MALMLSEQVIREACEVEHRALIRCYAQWDGNVECEPELWRMICHHHVVLKVLQDQLTGRFGTPGPARWHGHLSIRAQEIGLTREEDS
jgi:hypothetical protein